MPLQSTYRAKINLSKEQVSRLDDFSALYNRLQRKLYRDKIIKKLDGNELKRTYLAENNINARHYNSIKIELDGKVSSVIELSKEALQDKKQLIKKTTTKLKSHQKTLDNYLGKAVLTALEKSFVSNLKRKIWYAQKRLDKANLTLKTLESRIAGNPEICFGSRKLFRQQFSIGKENNQTPFKTHYQWSKTWRQSRNKTFMFVGSKDETAGNLNCQIKHLEGNKFQLKLNLNPRKRNEFELLEIEVNYGLDIIKNIILNNESKDKFLWQAITYRFYKNIKKKSYDVFISVDKTLLKPATVSHKSIGRIGVDINANHLAVTEIDHNGNIVSKFDLPYELKELSSNQSTNVLALVVKELTNYAVAKSKPVVIEKLDFAQKKKSLQAGINSNYNKMLSGFAYSKIISLIRGRCFDKGIELFKVNPAYTSIIGSIKYQKRYRLTSHQSASFVIARRGFGLQEKPVSINRQCEFSFNLPARNSFGNDFAYWNDMGKCVRKQRNRKKETSTPQCIVVT